MVKITRAAKGGFPELIAHQNFTVSKQALGTDVTTVPTVSLASGNNRWKNSGDKFDMTYTNLPVSGLLGGARVSNFTWTVAKASGANAPDGTPAIDSNGKLSGVSSSGQVIITMTAKDGDPKYSGSMTLANYAIATRSLADMSAPTISGVNAWKDSTATKFTMTYNSMPSSKTASAFTWAVVKDTTDAPSGTISIDQADGKLKGATSAGKVKITITAKANDKHYTAGTSKQLATYTIDRQDYPATVKTAHASWSRSSTAQIPKGTGLSIRDAVTGVLAGGWGSGKVTVDVEDSSSGLTDGANNLLGYRFKKIANMDHSNNTFLTADGDDSNSVSVNGRIAQGNDVFIGHKTADSPTANKAVKITFTFKATSDKKYKAKTLVTYWRTR